MDLGESKEQIANEAISIIEANKSDLIEGSNDIITYMNGHEARIKAFVKDGEVISGNVFKGTSNRESPNLINNKKSD